MNDPQARGFVYVATGAGYLAEALHSAATLRFHHPSACICLITDSPPAELGPFTEIRRPEGAVERRPIDKLLAYEAPYDKIVFIDTDTHILGDITSLFDLLERFDLALLQDVNRGWDYELDDVPVAFSEFNTGVIAFRKTPAVAAFFGDWHKNYVRIRAELNLVNDQPSFRRTLFNSSLRVAPIPSEFHFLGDFPNSTLWKVRLIHGRGNYARIERHINETLGLRAYVPELGVIPGYLGRVRLLKHLARLICRAGRLLFRGPQSVTADHPSKWWLEERKPAPKPNPPTRA